MSDTIELVGDAVARENWHAYNRGRDAHDKFIKEAEKFDAYYRGEQWSTEDRTKLEAQNRPALTINMVLSTVNAMLGEQISHRTDMTFAPASDRATKEVATALNKVVAQISRDNKLRWKEGQIFSDGLITGRGYFDVRVGFDDNVEGEVVITVPDPREVLPDPHARDYDPKSWNEVIVTQWKTIDEVEELYGKDKAEEVRNTIFALPATDSRDMAEFAQSTFGGDRTLYTYNPQLGSENAVLRRVRVVDRQYRKLERTEVFLDPTSGDYRPIPADWSKKKAQAFSKEHNLLIQKRLIKKIRWSVTAGLAVLHDDWSPYAQFTIVPFFAYFRRGKPFGLVGQLVSPQDQLNKASSQELHIVNTTANSGWMVPVGSLVNMTVDELETRGAETGLVLEVSTQNGTPSKIAPNQVPAGIAQVAGKATQSFRLISGVVDELTGSGSPRVSGVTLEKRVQGSLVQMELPFDNFRFTMELLAESVLNNVQSFYTDQRVIRVMDTKAGEDEQLVVNALDPATNKTLYDLSLGEYDISVRLTPNRETFDDTQFAEAMQLKEAGVMVPDDEIIRVSHLDRRDEIAARVQAQLEGPPPTEEQMQHQAMMMQMQMEHLMAELRDLTAAADLKSAQAQLAMAKAGATGDTVQLELQKHVDAMQTQMAQIRAAVAQTAANIQTKLELAMMHTQAKRDTTVFQQASKAQMKNTELVANAMRDRSPPTPQGQ